MKHVSLKVLRADPSTQQTPKVQEYSVPFDDGMRVSDALEFIYQELDHTLAFRCSCRISNCQVCLMKANGKTIYACQERLSDGMLLEPLPGYTVVRDLVVDFNTGMAGEKHTDAAASEAER
jgi:succinate dehydrogenase/fumarate reductase iron-sulfur protein